MKITRIEDHLLLGLNTQEALLLLRLLHASQSQGPSARELQRGGDAERLVKQLTSALLQPSERPMASGRSYSNETP